MGQVPNGNVELIENIDEAKKIQVDNESDLAYATQTTLSIDDTKEIIDVLKRFQNKRSIDEDICYATTNRQLAVKSISKICDFV